MRVEKPEAGEAFQTAMEFYEAAVPMTSDEDRYRVVVGVGNQRIPIKSITWDAHDEEMVIET